MAHDSFEYEMPAAAEVVFDTFHYHHWRCRWDFLVHATHACWAAPPVLTHRRFSRMRAFLATHAGQVQAWRKERAR